MLPISNKFLNIYRSTIKFKSFNTIIKFQFRPVNIAGNQSVRSPKYERPRSSVGYLFAILPVATFCLGTWQVYRLNWKLNLIAKLESIIKNDPIDFPEELNLINQMEYVKVKIKGHVDSKSLPQFIFPRSIIQRDENTNQPGTLITKGSGQGLGAQLVLPFIVNDERFAPDSMRILVNFGWINRETMDKLNSLIKNNVNFQFNENEIDLIGVIRKTEKREPFTPKKEYENMKGYWTRRDIQKMSEQLQTNPIFLDAFETYPLRLSYYDGQHERFMDLKPIGGQTRINLRNEHMSYIITWYSLTAIFSYLWYKKIFRTRL